MKSTPPFSSIGLLLAAVWLHPGWARAQAPEIELTADRTTVAVGERFQIQMRVTTRGNAIAEHIEIPNLDAFVVEGRSISRPMQFSFGFGQGPIVEQTTVYSFDLRPRQAGVFAVAAVEARVGGVVYRGQPLSITVLAAGAPSASPPPGSPPRDPFGNPLGLIPIPMFPQDVSPAPPPASPTPPEGLTGAQFDSDLFVRTILDKTSAYVGEQVTLTAYLYSRVSIRDLDVPQEPGTDGFWVEDLLGPVRRLDFQDQFVGSTRFQVAVVRKMALFPIRAGMLRITPMEIQATTGGFFGSSQLRRIGLPIELQVLPLPADGQPPGFEPSNVGRYELDARVDRPQVNAGEAVTFTVTVRGEGNLRNLRLPTLASRTGLRVYDPQVRDSIAPRADRIVGERIYEYLLMPEQAGRLELPRVSLSFFDPGLRQYRTRTTSLMSIAVVGSMGRPAEGQAALAARPALRSIRLRSALREKSPAITSAAWFLVAVGLPPLAYLGLALGTMLRQRRAGALARSRPRRALATSLHVLREAEAHRRSADATAFFAAVSRSLTTFLEERLGRPIGGMTTEELRRYLARRGYPDETVEDLIQELENCDFARFTPEGGRAREMDECAARTRRTLQQMDRVLPRPEPEA